MGGEIEDDAGLFWERPPVRKKKKAGAVAVGPVVLKPYVPRAPLAYEEMSREEVIKGAGGRLVFDIECFRNYFLVAFKSIQSGKVLLFEHPFDSKKLEWVLRNYTCVGFNCIKYDLPMVWLALVGAELDVLKNASDDLIGGMKVREAEAKYGFVVRDTTVVDLIEVCPSHGSLKLYGARLHAPRIQDVPWSGSDALEDWQIAVTRDYCLNDLDTTALLYGNLEEQLALREVLSREYNRDFMSKSDAQIAEEVIGREIARLDGAYPKRPKVVGGAVLKYKVPKNMVFESEVMKSVLEVVRAADFKVDGVGHLVRPDEIKEMKICIGGGVYRMGVGGLHSSEKKVALFSDEEHQLFDRDVASYYPAIVLQGGLAPKSLGENFLTVYRGLVERRLEAKRLGDIAVSENLKVAINGTFGKTGSPYSILYAPEMTIQITVGGQLYLLMLIERLEAAGVSVVSANTDGFVVLCPRSSRAQMLEVVAGWEKETGFITEETEYAALYSRDVNAYLAVKPDGRVKGKNVYYDPWRSKNARDAYWRFQKNPSCQVCTEAVEALVCREVPLEQTIRGCTDVKRFVAVKNVKGGAHKDGEYLGKVVRWYYALGEVGTINYLDGGRIVADTEGARPLMDLPLVFPDDVDHDWYVRKCEGMLEDLGLEKCTDC